jgi:hypothetical protein
VGVFDLFFSFGTSMLSGILRGEKEGGGKSYYRAPHPEDLAAIKTKKALWASGGESDAISWGGRIRRGHPDWNPKGHPVIQWDGQGFAHAFATPGPAYAMNPHAPDTGLYPVTLWSGDQITRADELGIHPSRLPDTPYSYRYRGAYHPSLQTSPRVSGGNALGVDMTTEAGRPFWAVGRPVGEWVITKADASHPLYGRTASETPTVIPSPREMARPGPSEKLSHAEMQRRVWAGEDVGDSSRTGLYQQTPPESSPPLADSPRPTISGADAWAYANNGPPGPIRDFVRFTIVAYARSYA